MYKQEKKTFALCYARAHTFTIFLCNNTFTVCLYLFFWDY